MIELLNNIKIIMQNYKSEPNWTLVGLMISIMLICESCYWTLLIIKGYIPIWNFLKDNPILCALIIVFLIINVLYGFSLIALYYTSSTLSFVKIVCYLLTTSNLFFALGIFVAYMTSKNKFAEGNTLLLLFLQLLCGLSNFIGYTLCKKSAMKNQYATLKR